MWWSVVEICRNLYVRVWGVRKWEKWSKNVHYYKKERRPWLKIRKIQRTMRIALKAIKIEQYTPIKLYHPPKIILAFFLTNTYNLKLSLNSTKKSNVWMKFSSRIIRNTHHSLIYSIYSTKKLINCSNSSTRNLN